jgi:O-methyltransferase involved in polyketide biosynthesis
MEKVHFTEEQSTNLATLYGRAMDSRFDDPILADPTAEETVSRIDYDFTKFGMGTDQALSIVMRAKLSKSAAPQLRLAKLLPFVRRMGHVVRDRF